jgi:DNA-binding PadR family transcriptional regulator
MASWECKTLEDFNNMFKDIYKENYQVIVIANRQDLIKKYYTLGDQHVQYFKSIFGENTIVVECPSIADWNSPFDNKKLFQENKLLLNVESNINSVNNPYWMLDVDKLEIPIQ